MTAEIKPLTAYNNDPTFKASLLIEVAWHREQDMLVKGKYGGTVDGKWQGCAVGCSIHSLARLQNRDLQTGDHSLLAAEIGVPVQLIHLQDAFFEALPKELSQTWPERFLDAIQPGADLSMVIPEFFYWLLQEAAKPKDEPPAVSEYVEAVTAVYEEWLRNKVPPPLNSNRAYLAYLADRADRAYLAYRAYLADRAYRAYLADRAYLAYLAYLPVSSLTLWSEKLLILMRAAPAALPSQTRTEAV